MNSSSNYNYSSRSLRNQIMPRQNSQQQQQGAAIFSPMTANFLHFQCPPPQLNSQQIITGPAAVNINRDISNTQTQCLQPLFPPPPLHNTFNNNLTQRRVANCTRRSSPPPFAICYLPENRQRKHNFGHQQQEQQPQNNDPQFWCGKGTAERAASKHVYNYAFSKDQAEKTPMCRIAELARYNKLKHEYILLDESGPAHKKKFVVKLVLCAGQEFEGSGPSIKKAQQEAAQLAIESTNLAKPPQQSHHHHHDGRRYDKRDEAGNPVILLNSVAKQLGISIHYSEECLHQPIANRSIINSPIKQQFHALQPIPATALPHFPYPPTAAIFAGSPSLSPNKGLNSILNLPLCTSSNGLPPPLPLPPLGPFPPLALFQNNQFPILPAVSLSFPAMSLFPAAQSTCASALSPSLLGPHPVHQPQQQQAIISSNSYRVTITLSSDASKHTGLAPNLPLAKLRAAVQALVHLRPELEQLKKRREEGPGQQNDDEVVIGADKKGGGQVSSPSSDNSSSLSSSSSASDGKSDSELIKEEFVAPPDLVWTNGGGNDKMVGIEQGEEGNGGEKKAEELLDGEQTRPGKRKGKSVVSQIHECALRLKMNVEFQVLAEVGVPHNRLYTLRCRLFSPTTAATDVNAKDFVAEAQGPSKKAAKQLVCQQLLQQIGHLLVSDPIQLASQIVRQSNLNNPRGVSKLGGRKDGAKEFGKRKTIIKDKKMDPDYGHHINPVSRLIQVMQARREPEPLFQLIAEDGQNRHKEFTVEVECMGQRECGRGPNKKLAKRAAAEAILAQFGYVKPMPQPGKSLLKRRDDESTEFSFDMIGFFEVPVEENNGEGATTQTKHVVDDGEMEWRPPHSAGEIQRKPRFETFADVEREESFGMGRERVDSLQLHQRRDAAAVCPPPTYNCNKNNNEGGKKIEEENISPPPPSADSTSTSSPDKIQTLGRNGGNGGGGGGTSSTTDDDSNLSATREVPRRRVTFSEQVCACPPPDDSSYPAAQIAPLRTQLGGKLKRRNRTQRILSAEDTEKLQLMVKLYQCWPNLEREKRGIVEAEEEEENGSSQYWAPTASFVFGTNANKGGGGGGVDNPLGTAVGALTIGIGNLAVEHHHHHHRHQQPPPPPQVAAVVQQPLLPALHLPADHLLSTPSPPPPLMLAAAPMPAFQPLEIVDANCKGRRFALVKAKPFLEFMAKKFKFTMAYSDFPKTTNAEGVEQCFTLLTLGLARPIVCHGSGLSEEDAHQDAALNAIRNSLSQLSSGTAK